MPHHPIPMPVRGDPTAPIFDGDPKHLRRFFHHVEHLAARAHATDSEKITSSVLYVEQTDYDLWIHIADRIPADWTRFKMAIREYYPFDDTLSTIACEAREAPIETTDDIGTYYRKFAAVALDLRKQHGYTERNIISRFLSGFPKSDHGDIKMLSDGAPDPTLHDIYKGALLAFHFDLDDFLGIPPSSHAPPDPPSPAPESVPDLTPSTTHSPLPPSPLLLSCHFCHDPTHMMRKCPIATTYLQKGLVTKDTDGKFVTPTGTRITRAIPGSSFQEQIDYWYRNNRTHAAPTTTSRPSSPPPPFSSSITSPPPSPLASSDSTAMAVPPAVRDWITSTFLKDLAKRYQPMPLDCLPSPT